MIVSEMERHLRALLRDVLCGYLEPDLKGLADDILLKATEEWDAAIASANPAIERRDPATEELEAIESSLLRVRRLTPERADDEPEPVADGCGGGKAPRSRGRAPAGGARARAGGRADGCGGGRGSRVPGGGAAAGGARTRAGGGA